MKKKRVLIVDDVSSHLLLLQNILEEEGYDTILFNEPKKALEFLNNEQIMVMLLDIMMPDMDGFQVLREIRTNKKLFSVKVVIISAKTDSKSIKQALDIGAFDYITKPINIQDVKNKVQAAFDASNI